MGYFLGNLSAGKGANGINICFGGGMFSPAAIGTWYLVVAYRGNGVIHRGIYQLQGDDNLRPGCGSSVVSIAFPIKVAFKL